MSEVTVRDGKVKWFDLHKRFGFVTLDGDPPVDAMMHVSVLKEIGAHVVVKGAIVKVQAEMGPRGLVIKSIISLQPPENALPRPLTADEILAQFVSVRVKWYSEHRGYGFVTRGGDTPDVFIHAETLHASCLVEPLRVDQELMVRIEAGDKGEKVIDVRFP